MTKSASKGPKLSDTKMREYSKASMTSSAPRKPQEQAGGALAEALRRAAEKNGRGKTGAKQAAFSVGGFILRDASLRDAPQDEV